MRHRPHPVSNRNVPAAVLVPSLANAPTVDGISQVELEAWATLSHSTRQSRGPKATVSFDRVRPSSALDRSYSSSWRNVSAGPAPQGTTSVATKRGGKDMVRSDLEHSSAGLEFGVATSEKSNDRTKPHQGVAKALRPPSTSAGNFLAGFRRTVDDSCIGAHSHGRPGCIAAGSIALARGQNHDGCSAGRAEHEAILQRQRGRDRSDISVRCVLGGIV